MTHSQAAVSEVAALARAGLPSSAIALRTGIPRGTVRAWLGGRAPRERVVSAAVDPEALPLDYLYLLGLYLGDGCLSRHPRGVFKLRLALDARYPGIVQATVSALQGTMPANSVNVSRQGTWVEVYCYSQAWPRLFPQHGPGKKHERGIWLAPWQRRLAERHPRPLLKGLIHSDGCRFVNTGRRWSYPRYSFCNLSAGVRDIFCEACDLLGVRWTWAPPKTIYVSRKADVDLLDEFIGPKG